MSTDLATQPAGQLAPSFDYGDMKGVGFENTTSDDMSLPFLTVLQALSPEVSGDKKIKGAEAGMLLNTVTKQLYSGEEGVILQPCGTNHIFMEWKPRNQGGGRVGQHDATSDVVAKAKEASTQFGKYKHNGNDLVETIYMVGLLHRDLDLAKQTLNGPGEPVMLSFQSTKIKPYKNLTYRIYTFAGKPPMFAHRIRIQSVQEKNNSGTFYNFKLTMAVNDDIASSLIPPSLDGQKHPLLVAGQELAKAFTSGLIKVNHDAGGESKTVNNDDIPF